MQVESPKFSNYSSNVRLYGWIRRFLDNTRKKRDERLLSTFLLPHEIQMGESLLLLQVQRKHFTIQPKFHNLRVRRAMDGLWHVDTKLNYRDDTEQFKNPILLPTKDFIVHQLIMGVHLSNCHAGTQFVLGMLREKFWILHGRKTVSNVINKCIICRRYSAKSLKSEPAPLPKDRVQSKRAFDTTGVDLAGPLAIKGGTKAWIVIYTCAVYRGVHLDVLDSLSTVEFMQSLERFIWLYGRPRQIYSDNGTNFVGANNLMKELNWDQMEREFQVKKIEWRFNPPTAAWWGGWWERLVRTAKDLLRRMIGRAKLSRKELVQCLAAISHTMNNRPLTVLTEDTGDLRPLTPAMFMRDLPMRGFPEHRELTSEDLRGAYWKMQNLKDSLRVRFRKEYLAQLVQRSQEKGSRAPAVGDVVIVGSDNKRRFEWPLGRVVEIMPGKDGTIRVTKVKTANGILLRPIQRLYPMEVSEPREDPISEHDVTNWSPSVMEPTPICDTHTITRVGRKVRKPIRYAEWNR